MEIFSFSLTAKSPVFTHATTTLSGLSVIRSTNAQKRMTRQFDALQDLQTDSWFMFLSMTSAFCQVVDLLAVIFITVLLGYFLLFPAGELQWI